MISRNRDIVFHIIHQVYDRFAFGKCAEDIPLDRVSVVDQDGFIALFFQAVTYLFQASNIASIFLFFICKIKISLLSISPCEVESHYFFQTPSDGD